VPIAVLAAVAPIAVPVQIVAAVAAVAPIVAVRLIVAPPVMAVLKECSI
jgi:hypothetical protein